MLRLDLAANTLIPVSSTTLTQAKVLERANLQAAIIRSWEAYCGEIGYEDLFLVASEVIPHESCDNRIDILALKRDGTPVVFELKRHRDRLQLLQAISYAAMVATWDRDRFLQALGSKNDEDTEELRSLLNGEGFELATAPEVVLIAESFDPEVILTANWLRTEFAVPISAFAVSAIDHKGDTLISLDQKFPVKGVDDVYVRRSVRTRVSSDSSSWDDALSNVEFPFAQRAVEIFRRYSAGSPAHRAFFSIYSGSPLGRMRINFKRNYLKIYTSDQSPEAEEALRSGLGPVFAVTTWGSENTKNSGFTFKVETAAQFDKFLEAVGETAR